jgi:hypothetical protein
MNVRVLVAALLSLLLAFSIPGSKAVPLDPRYFPNFLISPLHFEGRFSAEQLVDNNGTSRNELVAFARLSFSTDYSQAHLELGRFPTQKRMVSATLHCAAAGDVGPAVFELLDEPEGRFIGSERGYVVGRQITNEHIIATSADSTCGMEINNVASLSAASAERRLYVVVKMLDFQPNRLRAQLFHGANINLRDARELKDLVYVKSSSQQVVGTAVDLEDPKNGLLTSIYFYRGLDRIWYDTGLLPQPPGILSLYLHCAPPGQNGPAIAILQPGESGILHNADIMPTDEMGACGMRISNIASVYEAMLRGNLYLLATTTGFPNGGFRGQILPEGLPKPRIF